MDVLERCALAAALELGWTAPEEWGKTDELNEYDRKRAYRWLRPSCAPTTRVPYR
jgi:hypothetical protein